MTIIFQTIAFVIAVRNSLCWREKKQREQIFARGMQQLSNEKWNNFIKAWLHSLVSLVDRGNACIFKIYFECFLREISI